MVSSFHPELSDDTRLHELFLKRIDDERTPLVAEHRQRDL